MVGFSRALWRGALVALVCAVPFVEVGRHGATRSALFMAAISVGVFGMARVASRSERAALYSLVVLATLPLWFVRVRAEGAALFGEWHSSVRPTAGFVFTDLVAKISYELAPWAPLLPFAILVRKGPARVALSAAFVVALGVTAFFGLGTVSIAILSALVLGPFLADLDHNQNETPLLGIGALALAFVLARDLEASPDRVLDVFGGSNVPTGHSRAAARALRVAVLAVGFTTFIVTVTPAKYIDQARRFLEWRGGHVPRAFLIVMAAAITGVFLRAKAYLDLANRISPRRAYEAWMDRTHRDPADRIALYGIESGRWPSTTPTIFRSSEPATQFLLGQEHAGRSFLALGQNDLPRINASYRAARGQNLSVLAGQGAFMLAVDRLLESETSENPLDRTVLSSPPPSLRPTAAMLGENDIELLGWTIEKDDGTVVSTMRPRERAHLRIAFRVLNASTVQRHCTFIHIDHRPARFNAEHRDEPAYPKALWRAQDIVVDDYEVDLPPHFGRGTYRLFWGMGVLPCQDDARLRVMRGPHDDHNRVSLGLLEVR